MRRIPRSFFALAILISLLATGRSLAEAPRVVRIVPEHGEVNVDAALTEIRIEFDREMSRGGHSLCGGGPRFPEITGRPWWDGPRVFVLPVKLEAGHEYSFSVNCPAADNFRGADGTPAEITPVWFSTAAAGAPPKPAVELSPQRNRAAIEALRKAIDERYSYRDRLGLDWHALIDEAAPRLEAAKTPSAFARELGRVLAAARDPHVNVRVGRAAFPVYRTNVSPNADFQTLARVVPGWRPAGDCVFTGSFDDGIGYVMISSWSTDCRESMEAAYAALAEFADRPGVIVDVRLNGGGDELLAREFAGCFVEAPVVYSTNTYRDPDAEGGWGPVYQRLVEPSVERPACRGRTAVLIGPTCMSSNESFILMMREAGARLFGARTFGSSGNPKPHDLGNGVRVTLPSWKDMTAAGDMIEGRGIEPDEAVAFEGDGDPVLEAALGWLRE